MAKDYIGYENLVDQALRQVVRNALARVQKQGLIGSHHFYVTFKTHDKRVELPDFLRERYPDEMTIVLQNQYSGLDVTDEKFEVTLSFQKLPTTIVVPFSAVTGFADPAVQFGLQFKNATAAQQTANAGPSQPAPPQSVASPDEAPDSTSEKPAENPQVVSLDKFRKK
jgi:uncharacterized protein